MEIAEKAIYLAIALAHKAAPDHVKLCAQGKTRVKKRRVAFDGCQAALAALAKNHADLGANSVVGRYYSLDKHDWEKGLPYLIRGSRTLYKTMRRGSRRYPRMKFQPTTNRIDVSSSRRLVDALRRPEGEG